MTNKSLFEDREEHRAMCEAYHNQFNNKEITEKEYRVALASLGFNAVEIDIEVEQNKPIGW
jgi:hypothetical protein